MDEKILLVGLARDCGKTILNNIKRIDSALAEFTKRNWLVIESDSSDNTVTMLENTAQKISNFRFVSLGNLRERIPERTRRIAHCRNAYLEEIRSNKEYKDIEFVVVADLDGINDRISANAVTSCFSRTDWSVCTANQQGPYYDIYALRHDLWCPGDWWDQYYFAQGLGMDDRDCIRFACHSKMVTIAVDSDWIPVKSAFGGFAIYRAKCILQTDCNYEGTDDSGKGVCEHVPFHFALSKLGHKIYINPRLINARYTEHTRELVGRRQLMHMLNTFKEIVEVQTRRLVGR